MIRKIFQWQTGPAKKLNAVLAEALDGKLTNVFAVKPKQFLEIKARIVAETAGDLAPRERAGLRLAATHATASAARATDLVYNAGGGTSVYATSPLQRCFRDVHVATQHAMVASATWELTGRLLLGLDTDTSQL
jgi:alkylation response protein AidB-like acyl-CoA dehydrogenase